MTKRYSIDPSTSKGGRHLGSAPAEYFFGPDYLNLELDEVGEPKLDESGRLISKESKDNSKDSKVHSELPKSVLMCNIGTTLQTLHTYRGGNTDPVNIEAGDLFISSHYREIDSIFLANKRSNGWCSSFDARRTDGRYIQHQRGYLTCIGNIIDPVRKEKKIAEKAAAAQKPKSDK
jgi:hypothetical protein